MLSRLIVLAVFVALGTMGYKHTRVPDETILNALKVPGFLMKIIPQVDGTARVCELVKYDLLDLVCKGGWTGPAALEFAPHALAPLVDLPVLEVVGATHLVADLTLGLGEVVFDYLA